MKPRCTIHLLDANDLERSTNNPALASLIRDGWSVMANMMVETPTGNRIALILAPPSPQETGVFKIVIPIIFAILVHGATLVWALT